MVYTQCDHLLPSLPNAAQTAVPCANHSLPMQCMHSLTHECTLRPESVTSKSYISSSKNFTRSYHLDVSPCETHTLFPHPLIAGHWGDLLNVQGQVRGQNRLLDDLQRRLILFDGEAAEDLVPLYKRRKPSSAPHGRPPREPPTRTQQKTRSQINHGSGVWSRAQGPPASGE